MPAFSVRLVAAAAALCIPLALPALAQESAPPGAAREMPLQRAIGQVTLTGPVPSLFVLNARGATLADGKLTLTGVSPNSIVFADRPVRAAGHIETAQFVGTWIEGEDQFDIDPPNATISVLGGDGSVADAVVTISAPVLEGDNLAFDAVVLEGAIDGAAGAAALFIDRGGFGGFHGGGGFAGGGFRGGYGGDFGGEDHFSNYAHVQDPHAAWYRSDDSVNRTVNYDPHNAYYGGGGGGSYGAPYYHPWADAAAGAAVGAAVGAAAANAVSALQLSDGRSMARREPKCGFVFSLCSAAAPRLRSPASPSGSWARRRSSRRRPRRARTSSSSWPTTSATGTSAPTTEA